MSHCDAGQKHVIDSAGHSACEGTPTVGDVSERATCTDRPNMAFDFGMQDQHACYLRKFRWLFMIEGVSGVAKALPPLKAARPTLSFREQMVAHLVENIYYPVRPEWKPITLTLYEIRQPNILAGRNPVMEWVQKLYNSTSGDWLPIHQEGCGESAQGQCFKRNAILCLYDGCGKVMESWQLDNIWPQNVVWGELDMGTSDIVTVDVTLRYDRAWIKQVAGAAGVSRTPSGAEGKADAKDGADKAAEARARDTAEETPFDRAGSACLQQSRNFVAASTNLGLTEEASFRLQQAGEEVFQECMKEAGYEQGG